MIDEIPMGAGAVIVNADTGEVAEIPFTEEQLVEKNLVLQRIEDVIPVG